jgi:dTDP-4-dehydrorhamnose reductase
MKILLFGKNGQVGWELQRTLKPLGELVTLDLEGDNELCGNFTDLDGLRRTIQKVKPDVIVNAAAYTAVDKAESEASLAMEINAEAPRALAEEASALGACIVHYSTDFVFDGKQKIPYTELDAANPLSEYGKSKLAGDIAVMSNCARHLIFRTSWVFGVHGNNFLKTILKLAAERTSLRVVVDQVGTPTEANLIATTTAKVLAVMATAPAEDSRWGIYNLVAGGQTSWHGFATYIVERARAAGMRLDLRPEAIAAIPTTEYPLPAARPAYSVLNTEKLNKTFDLSFPLWQVGADRVTDSIVGK